MSELKDIEEAIASATAKFRHVCTIHGEPAEQISAHALVRRHIDADLLDEVAEAIRVSGSFTIFDGLHQVIANSSGQATYRGLAEWLIARSFFTSPSQGLKDLLDYVANPAFLCYEVMGLQGIKVETAVQLEKDIRLVPRSALPEMSQLIHLDLDQPNPHIDAFLLRERDYPVLHKQPGDATMHWSLYEQYTGDFEEARLALTLVGPSSPVAMWSWITPESRVPLASFGLGGGRSGMGALQIINPVRVDSDPQEIQRVHRLFLQLPDDRMRVIRLAIQRLNASMRKEVLVDRAIDLGIATEVVFSTKRERGGSFRIALRAAHFLSDEDGSISKRGRYELFKQLYEARSDAVHTGELKSSYLDLEPRELFRKCQFELSRAIVKLMETKGNVDWLGLVLEE